jgi:hypothetical protein
LSRQLFQQQNIILDSDLPSVKLTKLGFTKYI